MLDFDKPIRRISDKAPVRIICTDRKGYQPVVYLVDTDGSEVIGFVNKDGVGSLFENVPETITGYVNVYPDRFATYSHIDAAERRKRLDRVSLLKVEILDGEIVSWEKLK